jgi:hypothetical protein
MTIGKQAERLGEMVAFGANLNGHTLSLAIL